MVSTEGLTALKTVVRGEQERDASSQYRGGKSSTVMTAAVLSGGSERVWEVEGDVVMHGAEGEVKGRSAVKRRVRALARSGRAHVGVWHALDVTGTSWAGCSWLPLGRGRCLSCSGK
jgi:hypothetical protein